MKHSGCYFSFANKTTGNQIKFCLLTITHTITKIAVLYSVHVKIPYCTMQTIDGDQII